MIQSYKISPHSLNGFSILLQSFYVPRISFPSSPIQPIQVLQKSVPLPWPQCPHPTDLQTQWIVSAPTHLATLPKNCHIELSMIIICTHVYLFQSQISKRSWRTRPRVQVLFILFQTWQSPDIIGIQVITVDADCNEDCLSYLCIPYCIGNFKCSINISWINERINWGEKLKKTLQSKTVFIYLIFGWREERRVGWGEEGLEEGERGRVRGAERMAPGIYYFALGLTVIHNFVQHRIHL